MPFYLKESDVLPRVTDLKSVLIVPCRFCPAASMAVRKKKPYIELFRRFLRTEAYETFIRALQRHLEEQGIRTAIFDSKWPHQMVACMWTSRRRGELARRAAGFEGIVVLGCEATVDTVCDTLGDSDCRVINGMENEGIMVILPTMHLPCSISLELKSISNIVTKESKAPE